MNASLENTIIVGVGDGGCQIASTLATRWNKAPQALLINTDLDRWPHIAGIKIATHITENIKNSLAFAKTIELGTGGTPRFGRKAAELYASQIKDAIEKKSLAIIVASLGGGTGTGAAPFIVEMAANLNIRTIVFATLPFEFEGERRMEQALRGLMILEETADCVITLPNQRILDLIDDKTNPQAAFLKSDELLSDAIEIFWKTLTAQNVINVDLSHIGALMDKSAGKTVFVYASADGEGKIESTIDRLIANPILSKENALSNTSAYLVSVMAGPDFSLKEIETFTKMLSKRINIHDAMQMLGIGINEQYKDKLVVLFFAREKPAITGTIIQETDKTSTSRETMLSPKKAKSVLKKKDIASPDLFSYKGITQFKGVAPTIIDGVNMDIPTWIRRRIPIQKPSHD